VVAAPYAPGPHGYLRRVQENHDRESAFTKLFQLVAASVVAGVLVAFVALPGVSGIGVTARDAAAAFDNMPSELNTSPPPEKTVVYAANGSQLATFFDEYRESVRLDQVADVMRKSIVAIEDSRFYEHGALDIKAAIRALATNAQAGATKQGGSSLTQQYVKNLLLENADTPAQERAVIAPTVGRKLRELRYALDIEKKMSKDQILQGYLNVAYFGAGAYGVQAAAKRYFDKPASKLNLAESALLAGVTNSPYAYDPTLHQGAALKRRNTVLYRMSDLGIITRQQADRTANEPIKLNQHKPQGGCDTSKAPFFCEYVRYEMLNILSNGTYWKLKPSKQAVILRKLKRGGYNIRTTLDPQAQRAAEDGLASEVASGEKQVGVQAMVEPGTGKLKAIATSKGFGNGKQQTSINLAADSQHGGGVGVSAGSTFKVFTLMAALDQGIPVSTSFNSPAQISIGGFSPCVYDGYMKIDNREMHGKNLTSGTWDVGNAGDSEKGQFNLRTGTWHSVNTFYAQLERRVGVCDAIKMAENFGLKRADGNRLLPFTSQVLGTNEVDMVHLSAAYAGIAARGKYCAPIAITEVTDAKGNKLKVPKPDCQQAVDRDIADETTKILKGVLSQGTAKGVPSVGRPAAGKTGTCESYSCAVFAGYTPNLASAVAYWDIRGGFKYPVYGVYGATIPGPIWARSMRQALEGRPVMSFTEPTNDFGDVTSVDVPDLKGASVGVAKAELAAAGFSATVSPSPVQSDQPIGTVAYTTPSGGSKAEQGTTVLIFISNGKNVAGGGPGNGNGNPGLPGIPGSNGGTGNRGNGFHWPPQTTP
jgi:membrane peptidoglycan carboxypeptidase